MPKRVKLLQDIYMPLDGQWQMVLSGSVVDIPDTMNISAAQATQLSPGEAAGALHPTHQKPTSVRDVRKPKG